MTCVRKTFFAISKFFVRLKSKHRKSLATTINWNARGKAVYFRFILFVSFVWLNCLVWRRQQRQRWCVCMFFYDGHKYFECLQFQDKPLIGVVRARWHIKYFYVYATCHYMMKSLCAQCKDLCIVFGEYSAAAAAAKLRWRKTLKIISKNGI